MVSWFGSQMPTDLPMSSAQVRWPSLNEGAGVDPGVTFPAD